MIGSSNSRAQLMAPTLLIDLGPKTLRHARRFALLGRVASRTGRSCRAAGTCVDALPRPIGMVLADPSAILAKQAFHRRFPSAMGSSNLVDHGILCSRLR